MASTNSYNFVVTRDQLITDAHLHIGAIGEGESPTSSQVTEAARILNMLVKLRAAVGMPAWAMRRGVILPVTDVSSVSTISHIVQEGSYVQTTISADEAASQTVLSVTSSTGMTGGDQVGIELTSGSMDWTTIVSVDSATQITITTALTGASASGSRVYAYTASADRIPRPLRIIHANTLDLDTNTASEIEIMDRETYYSQSNRTSEGDPSALWYDQRLGTEVADPTSATTWYGTVFLWPRFQNGDTVVEFTYQRPFQDFDAASDHPDFPQEFYLPLMLELAALISRKFGYPQDERTMLFTEARAYLKEALESVSPEGSMRVQPSGS